MKNFDLIKLDDIQVDIQHTFPFHIISNFCFSVCHVAQAPRSSLEQETPPEWSECEGVCTRGPRGVCWQRSLLFHTLKSYQIQVLSTHESFKTLHPVVCACACILAVWKPALSIWPCGLENIQVLSCLKPTRAQMHMAMKSPLKTASYIVSWWTI